MSETRQIIRKSRGSVEEVAPGFPVRRAMPSEQMDHLDPFLLLDHAGPFEIEPTDQPGGIDAHPHRGFETVTVLLQGEIAHRDSAGNSGELSAGDVQWMTAGSGIVHEERHGTGLSRRGGTLELVQLWLNLPAAKKDLTPGYQDIRSAEIPIVEFADHKGFLRVIAGEQRGHRGPATTQTNVTLFDISLEAGATEMLSLPVGQNCGLYVSRGTLRVSEAGPSIEAGELAELSSAEADVTIHADSESRILVIGGDPIKEPIAARGPFVMNSDEELRQAFADYKAGKYGTL